MKNDLFDGFTVDILQDKNEWVAHFIELPNVSAYGDNPNEALSELQTAWELMKECYEADGEPIPIAPSRKQYSGHFNVRIDKRIHQALAMEAMKAGVSLNSLVSQKLAQSAERI